MDTIKEMKWEEGYNKGIEDFVEKLIEKTPKNFAGELELGGRVSYLSANQILEIAEKLKEGVNGKDANVTTKNCSKCSRRSWYQRGYADAERNNGWIPCEVALPPQPQHNPLFDNKPLELYLVSLNSTDYPWRVFWNGKYFTDGWTKVNAIAWQPLPPAYKQKRE